MTFKEITADLEDQNSIVTLRRWLDRGDGIALYENHDLGSPLIGHKQWASYGSPDAQLETDTPPLRLRDIGGKINWAYQLIGTCRL